MQAGERHAVLGNWTEASASLKRSLEGFKAVCGKKDKRASDVAKMLTVSFMLCCAVMCCAMVTV